MRKAYKIQTKLDVTENSYSIYSAETAGKAKTTLMSSVWESYPEENYSVITSCKRCPEYDELGNKYSGCIAWRQGWENWQQDKGHWYDYEHY